VKLTKKCDIYRECTGDQDNDGDDENDFYDNYDDMQEIVIRILIDF
jgi:hypothetical protein